MGAKMIVTDLKEADLQGKIVFVKVDLNVLLGDNSKITCWTRDCDALTIIKHLMDQGAKVILSGHLGRTKGVTPKYSLKHLVPRLSERLGIEEVKMANDSTGGDIANLVAEIPEGGILLIENVFNNPEFAKTLASLVDLYVDAYGIAHRASTERIIKYLKSSGKKFAFEACCCWFTAAISTFVGGGDAPDEIA